MYKNLYKNGGKVAPAAVVALLAQLKLRLFHNPQEEHGYEEEEANPGSHRARAQKE